MSLQVWTFYYSPPTGPSYGSWLRVIIIIIIIIIIKVIGAPDAAIT